MIFFLAILFVIVLFAFGQIYDIGHSKETSVQYDKGTHAEYLTYQSLRHFENQGGRFLFNALIPKGNGKTTEIDIILIFSKGIFVFECKNYSGWIFGNETQRNWTQTLPQGRGRCHKEYFYNPIMQNATHIRYLKTLIGKNISMQSIIVFSDRCTLKNITIKSHNVSVINLDDAAHVVTQICNDIQTEIFTEKEINDIYNKIYPCTQFDYELREKHIEDVKKIKWGQA